MQGAHLVASSTDSKSHLAQTEGLFQKLLADEKGFAHVADALKLRTGIHLPLSSKNLSLIASRLMKVLPNYQIDSYRELVRALQAGHPELEREFIEAMTTNKTSFFRENHHFEILPGLTEQYCQQKIAQGKSRELKIWCAAASRGHEPYSILRSGHE